MTTAEEAFAQLCIPSNKVRETYYSETYRAEFKLNGLLGIWDITHISVPFSLEKERELIRRLQILDEESLIRFYQDFMQRLHQEQAFLRELRELNPEEEPGETSISYGVTFANYRIRKSFPNEKVEWGRSYYLISEQMDPIIGSDFIPDIGQISLYELITLGTKFTRTLRLLSGTNIHVGTWDLDSIYVIPSTAGKKRIVNGCLLYGGKDGGKLLPQMNSIPKTAHESVQNGAAPSLATDLYAVGAILWNLCSGRYWAEEPDLTETPKYATDKLTDLLKACFEGGGEEELRRIHTGLHSLAKEIKGLPDSLNQKIPMIVKVPQNAERCTMKEPLDKQNFSADRDPMLEGMQLIEASLSTDGQEAGSTWEFVDVPFDIVQEKQHSGEKTPVEQKRCPSIQQRTPLKPRRSDRVEKGLPDAGKKQFSSKKGFIKPVLAAVAVLAIGLFGWSQIFLQSPSPEDSHREVLEHADVAPTGNVEDEKEDSVLGPTIEAEKAEEEDTKDDVGGNHIEKSSKQSGAVQNSGVSSGRPSSGSTSSNKPYGKPSNNSSSNRPSSGNSSNSSTSGSSSSNKPSSGNSSSNNSSSSKPSSGTSSNNKPSSGSPSGNTSNEGSSSSGTTRPLQPSFSVSPGSVSISIGGSVSLSANAPCSFSTSNSAVAYVSGRSVVGVAAGTCTITAISSVDGTVRTIVVSVH